MIDFESVTAVAVLDNSAFTEIKIWISWETHGKAERLV